MIFYFTVKCGTVLFWCYKQLVKWGSRKITWRTLLLPLSSIYTRHQRNCQACIRLAKSTTSTYTAQILACQQPASPKRHPSNCFKVHIFAGLRNWFPEVDFFSLTIVLRLAQKITLLKRNISSFLDIGFSGPSPSLIKNNFRRSRNSEAEQVLLK